jgi:lipopolysaccharide heptosyltransferase I
VHILIVKPSSFGDVVHTFPALSLLRRSVSGPLRLTWVVNDSLVALPSLLPGVDRVVAFPRRQVFRCPAWRNFLRELRSEPYDAALDFQGLFRSGLIAWLSRAPRRIGFRQAREGAGLFYTEKYSPDASCRHAVDKNIALVRRAFPDLDEAFAREAAGHPPLAVTPAAAAAAQDWLRRMPGDGPVLAIGFSSRWPSKTWPREFFAAVVAAVAAQVPGLRCWLLGSPSERVLGDELAAAICQVPVLNCAGATEFGVLAAMLQASQALLTNDSGPMHLAAAMGTPCIALFGATDPARTGPWGPAGHHVVVCTRCPAHPCFERICPRGQDVCPQGTDPAAVAAQVARKLLSAAPST